jgi:hypothetical protein
MLKVSDYFITPRDIAHAFRWRYVLGVIVGMSVAIGLGKVGVEPDIAILVSVIIMAVLWRMDARVPFGLAIACFIGVMVASLMPQAPGRAAPGDPREALAVSAFYCLVIGVALLIREQIVSPKRKYMARRAQRQALAFPATKFVPPQPSPIKTPIRSAIPGASQQLANKPVTINTPATFKPHLAPHPALQKSASPKGVRPKLIQL